jgi:parvulin-like peptidyl-prolyl isomerase
MSRRHHHKVISRPGRSNKRRLAMVFGGLVVLAACLTIRHYWSAVAADAQSPSPPAGVQRSAKAGTAADRGAKPAARQPAPSDVVGTVNGQDVTRDELGRECLRHYGKEVLGSVINKYLIAEECRRLKITITEEEVNAEIERLAKRFGLPTDQWLKMLKDERGVKPAQYGSDIVWPTLALRKLAGEKLQVTRQEVEAEYETRYGPAVKARLIVTSEKHRADKAHAEAVADPAAFGRLSKTYSDDSAVASIEGMVQPIRKHAGNAEIERCAFTMKDGDVSPVIAIGNQYVIVLREGLLPGSDPAMLPRIRPQVEEMIRDRKLRSVATTVFHDLQSRADVKNMLNDPELGRQMPGVAAVVDGRQIGIRELAELCIERHGEEVLEGTMNRRLIEQACKKRNVVVTDADVDREIARAAGEAVPLKDGRPDVDAWLKIVTQRQGVSAEVYRHDAVWPSVALKKLVGDTVQVTNEDLKNGYEANYGRRIRCRAIMMTSLRTAQRVWEMARKTPTVEYFGDLAEKYCADANMRALRGDVPPIQQHGGQPDLEEKAFRLKPGELSSIVQVGQQYIILLCTGYTEPPAKVDFAAVRDDIYKDVFEKKQRLAMSHEFQELQDRAKTYNFLAGTTHTPKVHVDAREDGRGEEPKSALRAGSAFAAPGAR